MSAAQLVAAFATGELSPVEVIDNTFDTIAQRNPTINAMFLTTEESARTEAHQSEKRWRNQTPRGRFDGVPTVIKEGLDAAGLPNYRGSAVNGTRNPIATADAPSVIRLKDAGAIVIGKTSQADYGIFATGVSTRHGPARNPINLDFNTSGSSGGTAAAIGAGFCPIGIGTDIVGSIRHPASFCGLWGFKPTFGAVPYSPPVAPGLCAGPLARSIDDATALFDVIRGQHQTDSQSLPTSALVNAGEFAGLRGLTVGVISDFGFGNPTTPDVLQALEEVVELVARAGANVVRIDAAFRPEDLDCVERFHQTRVALELAELPGDEHRHSPDVDEWCQRAGDMTALELHADLRAMAALRVRTDALSAGVHVLLTTTVAVPPYPFDQIGEDPSDPFRSWSNCFLFNLTEQPALSMPTGSSSTGLPIGTQLIGQRFHDHLVLNIGREISRCLELT